MARTIQELSLLEILPPNLRQDPKIQAAAQAIDAEMFKTTENIMCCIHIARIDELPETVLDLLAWQWHVDFYEPVKMDIDKKRQLIKQSIAWHRMKGTPAAVENVVTAAFDKATVLEWFEYGGKPYFFKVRTEDITTDTETINEMKRAISSVKNTRSWLEKIEFILHLKDDYDDVSEQLAISAQRKMMDAYPWQYQKYDGSARYGNVAVYDGQYAHDGTLHYDMAKPGTMHYDANKIEDMGLLTAKLSDIEDKYITVMRYDGENLYNGVQRYCENAGPQDNGGNLVTRQGIYYNGKRMYDGGNISRYTGSTKYDGSSVYDGGNIRQYRFKERVEKF